MAVCGILLAASLSLASDLRETPIVKAVQRARPSVVNIRGEKTLTNTSTRGDSTRRVNGMGTGVVIDPRGYVVTNHHVVDGVREIQVTTADEQRYTARLICRDPETDLAIIKIDPREPLPVITIGSSTDLMPGESVIAVGNAYGYEHTVTRGIISALHRAVQVSDAQFYENLIQTDASINPGNSGGPLLNIDGEMIGINVAVRAGAQGIGFAIPVNKAMAVTTELLANCGVKSVYHGIRPMPESDQKDRGMVVASADRDSPAAEVGLQPGDRITMAGDVEVNRPMDFYRAILELSAGKQLPLTVDRSGQTFAVALKLAAARPQAGGTRGTTWEVLGMDLRPIDAGEFRQKFQTQYRGGLSVVAVRPDSPAAVQGIRAGDVLVGIHVWETISLDNVAYILGRSDFTSLSPVKFFILRGSETLYGYLPVGGVKTASVK